MLSLSIIDFVYFFFFFKAEDGIRDKLVTGVQTCALPISVHEHAARLDRRREALSALPARGPEGRAEPEGRVVREANGILFVARAHDGRHRAEGLLARGGEAEDLPEGEVPRHDGEHGPQRVEAHVAP